MKTPSTRGAATLAATAVALLVSSCGVIAGDSGATEPAVGEPESSEAAAMLPSDLRDAGVIEVATDAHYAPMDYYEPDGKTLTGADYEMGQAIGRALGVEMRVTDVSFDNIIPGLQSGQYDLAVTFMSDTAERQQQVDFVDTYQSGSSILVQSGNPEGIEEITDLCGETAVTTKTSVQIPLAESYDDECAQLGKDPIDVMTVKTDTDALLQVKSGRATADLAESVAAAYNARTSGDGADFEVVGDVYNPQPVGMVIPKGEHELRGAVQAALEHLQQTGEYDRILADAGLEVLAVESFPINSAEPE